MAYLVAHFDESGKFADKDIVSLAGFVADSYAWEHFNAAWGGLLRNHGIRTIKASEALRFARPFGPKLAATGIDARISVLQKYVKTIQDHLEFGVACAVDARAFRSLGKKQQDKLKDPHYTAFRCNIGTIREHIADGDTVSLLCDDESAYSVECYKIFTAIRQSDNRVRRRFISIGFGDDYHFPQIQAADLFAGLLRCDAERQFLGSPFPMKAVWDRLLAPSPESRLEIRGYFYAATQLQELAG